MRHRLPQAVRLLPVLAFLQAAAPARAEHGPRRTEPLTTTSRPVGAPASCCEGSPGCAERGLCSAHGTGCVAGTDAHCRSASVCGQWGACVARGGQCVIDPAVSCTATPACRQEGRCAPHPAGCVAAADSDCQRSAWCRYWGHCFARGGTCSRDPCWHTRGCRAYGRCTTVGGNCIATRESDCRRSRACREGEDCFLNAGKGRCDAGLHHADPNARGLGIALIAAGGVATLLGSFMLLAAGDDDGWLGPSEEEGIPTGLGLVIGGAVVAGAIGVPLVVIGGEKVPHGSREASVPEVSLGPAGAALRWSF